MGVPDIRRNEFSSLVSNAVVVTEEFFPFARLLIHYFYAVWLGVISAELVVGWLAQVGLGLSSESLLLIASDGFEKSCIIEIFLF